MSDDLRTTRDYERAAAETIIHLPKLVADEFGLSTSEARRLQMSGAVKLNGCEPQSFDLSATQAGGEHIDGR
ncbi:MAG: hypothetical protein JSS68_09740 [Actinobacteria bacterium]|nr:hypothetical protein [Actinomycetota bacterium]